MFRRLVLTITAAVTSLLFATFMSPVSPVSALDAGDIVLSLTPSEQDLELSAGSTYSGQVSVSNIGRYPFQISVDVVPYYVNEVYDPDFENDSYYTQLSHWITLPQTEFSLSPNETLDVPFNVKVPADAVSGGQYAALLINTDSNLNTEENGVIVNSQLAAILRGHIDGTAATFSGELVDHSLPQLMFNRNLSISQTVKNTGNTDFKVTQTLTVRNFFTGHEAVSPSSLNSDGHPIGTSTAIVLPGTTRSSILTWEGAPKLGIFRVEQTIQFLDQSYFYQQIVLLCPLWLLLIIVIAIFALIFSIIARIRRSRNLVDSL